MLYTDCQHRNAVISNDLKDIQDIHLPSKNIAIYQRNIEILNDELDQLAYHTIECRASGTIEEIVLELNKYFEINLSGAKLLLEDISKLLRVFETTTKAKSLRLLFRTVITDMCRKFHTDINDLRLLCTYKGSGTLWLPDEAIDFKALESRGKDEDIVKDKQMIQQVNTGDVVFLKGALYPNANPILHQSPAIEASGEKRLLLRIDTNEFLNF